MKADLAMIAARAGTCLLAGFALAALGFSSSASRRPGVSGAPADATAAPTPATGNQAGGADAETPAREALDVESVVAFARRLQAMDDTASRSEAVMAWSDRFAGDDFSRFLDLLIDLDGDGIETAAAEGAEAIDELSDWLFDEDIFAQRLYEISEVAAVRWMVEDGSEHLWIDEILATGISDGAGVLQELVKLQQPEAREEALDAFFEYIIHSDPGSALELLEAHRTEIDEEFRAEALGFASAAWVLQDPAARLELGPADYDATATLGDWLLRDHQAARQWCLDRADDPAAEVALREAVTAKFDRLPFDFAIQFAEPASASEWAAGLSDEQLDALVAKSPSDGIAELYRRDPWSAGSTLLADGHGDSLPHLITPWVARDSIEASRFIREHLQAGPERDLAVQALAVGIAARDPAAAEEWAATIADAPLRASVLQQITTTAAP